MRSISSLLMAFVTFAALAAPESVTVSNLNVERSESTLLVSMDLDATSVKVKSDREIKYMPVITDGVNRAELPTVTVAGRNRYIQNLRHSSVQAPAVITRPGSVVAYSASIPYQQWMQESRLMLLADECDCGLIAGVATEQPLTDIDFVERKFTPTFVFVTPPAELAKTRSVKGSAYIDFPVGQTAIRPDYRRNPEELAKIRSTIGVVKDDPDSRITSVSIVGYASPEGSYAANERLAQGRAASLAEYVRSLYTLDPGVMHTSSVAENWEGLRDYVAHSSLPDTTALLAVIDDSSLAPDAREWRLKKNFPKEYAFLLADVYPGLRRSDYTVDYVIRSFVTVQEIKEVMATAPQKLSLNEIYVVANSLDPESDAYREAFELAVRMFPNDPVANLNMASIALGRDELNAAQAYLAKAGDSPRATYARGVLAAKRADYPTAVRLLNAAASQGIPEATDALGQLRLMKVID